MAKTQWQKDPNHGFIWNCIDHLATWYDGREKHAVNRKIYLRLCILGIFGAHQFYAKRWSGFSIAMTLVDAIIAVPMKPDENGLILL